MRCQTPRPELLDLAARFLHLVFAEMGDAGAHRLLDGLDRLRFAHGDQFDFGRIAARLLGGGGDGLLELRQGGRKNRPSAKLIAKSGCLSFLREDA